jgi:DNA ligase-1
MSLITKPMLAAKMENAKKIKMEMKDFSYPLAASIKLDGIRCLRSGGKTLSRSFMLIPNKYVQAQMAHLIDGLDGELVTYNEDGTVRTFSEIQGDIMSEDGEPNFRFEIFDYVKDSLKKPYTDRINDLKMWYQSSSVPEFCTLVLPTVINNEEELLAFEIKAIADGHEGVMTRRLNGGYKCGKATWKSQDLVKIKRFVDSEALVLGFEEKLHNGNEAQKDEFGRTKRSSNKDNLVPLGTLGTFVVRDIYDGREFKIGTGKGLGDKLRKEIWDNQSKYLGKMVKYRYQEVGTKDKPRIPSFLGFRDERDMS